MRNYSYFIFLVLNIFLFSSKAQTDVWKTIQTNYSDMSGVIYTPAKDTVFIHRIDGVLLRSFNGATSWDSTFIRHDSLRFTDVGSYFVNGKLGFTWGIWGCMYTGIKQERAVLLKTNNSGDTWELTMNGLPLQELKNISLVHFWDKDNGMLVAECGASHHENHIYTTFDGGSNWIEASVFNPMIKYAPRMASFIDRYTGVMCGMELNLKFSLTDNGGYDWKNNIVHQLNYSPTGIKLFNDNSGFILANDSVFLTDNNFKYYVRKALPFTNYNNTVLSNNASFYSLDNNTNYFLTFNDGIFKTTDGFSSFTVSKPKNNLPNYSIAGFENEVYVYALNGLVYKSTIEKTQSTSLKNEDLSLFPNPATGDLINLKTNLQVKSYSISNVLGMIVSANSALENNTIDLKHLSNGTYVISFYGDNDELISTKKVIKHIK